MDKRARQDPEDLEDMLSMSSEETFCCLLCTLSHFSHKDTITHAYNLKPNAGPISITLWRAGLYQYNKPQSALPTVNEIVCAFETK